MVIYMDTEYKLTDTVIELDVSHMDSVSIEQQMSTLIQYMILHRRTGNNRKSTITLTFPSAVPPEESFRIGTTFKITGV